MKVFELKDLNLIQQIEKSHSNSYMGFVYILELGNMVKIGSTYQPYQRLIALKRQAEKYGNIELGKFALSKEHTNYIENENMMHEHFKKFRKDGTELFNISMECAIEKFSKCAKLLDENEVKNKESEACFNFMKDFISGKIIPHKLTNKNIETTNITNNYIEEKPKRSTLKNNGKGDTKYMDNTNIEELKSHLCDYVQKITTISKNGGKNQYVCSLCNSGTGIHHSGAFTVYPNSNSYHCFACGENGDIFTLYGKINHIDNFKTILYELSNKYSIHSQQPKDYTKFFSMAEKHLQDTDYITQRGLSFETQMKFNCGYVPNFIYKDNKSTYAIIILTSDSSIMWRSTTENIKQKRGTAHILNTSSLNVPYCFVV